MKWRSIFFLATALLMLQSCSKEKSTEPVAQVPTLATATITVITQTTAECGGTITSDGGATVTARGVCWSTNQAPTVADNRTTDGTGAGSFTSSITGLTGNTSYHVRAYATNSVGTGYGSALLFTTEASMTSTVMDIDSNVYQTIKIGNQWWMAENLKVTHYRNGVAIPNVTDGNVWGGLTTGAYCSSFNDNMRVATYGRLYNWFAVSDSRNIAPAGWHVATDAEWQTLIDYLGGGAVAGGKMKEIGTTHWISPNAGTNESGFSALPGGFRTSLGYFGSLGYWAIFWSSTWYDSDQAWYRELLYDYPNALREYGPKGEGASVRCVKN